MASKKGATRRQFVNPNLVSLKLLLFLFFGGMGCLLPFLPLHMQAVGLTPDEGRIVSIISGLVATLGPLVAGPVADKLAGRQGNQGSKNRYLRVMIAVACILSALFYSLLLLVPSVGRTEIPCEDEPPPMRLWCDRSGATVYRSRSNDEIENDSSCHVWPEERVYPILLSRCRYVCNDTSADSLMWMRESSTLPYAVDDSEFVDDAGLAVDGSGNADADGDITAEPLPGGLQASKMKDDTDDGRAERGSLNENGRKRRLPPPHLCFQNSNGTFRCHAFTDDSSTVSVDVAFEKPINFTREQKWCVYPLSEYVNWRIPRELSSTNDSCSVECLLGEAPATFPPGSLCQRVTGDPEMTFWIYATVRSLADVFPTAAVALIDAAVVIATRETSSGRGDVGRQLAFGSLGFAIFAPFTGYLATLVPRSSTSVYLLPIPLFAIFLLLLSALVAFCATGMPLGPPEWWWHTRSGMLALPMSAIKRYGSETAALLFVLVIMGIFWSVLDTYLPLHLASLKGDELSIAVALTLGALPAIPFLWKSEHLVDYCGHSNLLITAFTVYIVRFIGLSLVQSDPWWALVSEALEVFTLGIAWVTAILYLRHLVPRHLTVTAQALPVIAHFCIGRCLGAIIGGTYVDSGETTVDSLRFIYHCMAMAAAAVAIVYFILYHGLLKPRCHAQTIHGSYQPPAIVQAMNGNGSYTPLRVYHNGRGKKGEFRY